MRIKSSLCLISSLFLGISSSCYSNLAYEPIFENFRPFMGTDIQIRNMGFADLFGGNLFAKNLAQFDLYAGIRLFEYVGVAIGFEESKNQNRNVTLNDGDIILGLIIEPGEGPESHFTQTKVKGTFVEIMGFYPVFPEENIDLFASVGVVRNQLMLQDTLLTIDDIPLIAPIVRTYHDKKTMPRLTLGIQKIFCTHIGIKGMIAWEDTSRFSKLKPLEVPDASTNVDAKGSFIYSVGLFATM